MWRIVVIISLLAFAACGQLAADEPVFSGPQVGELVQPLRVVLGYGEDAGSEVDLVERAGSRALLLVFVNGANRPAARLTRALMNYAEMRTEDGLFGAVVWLDGDRSAAQKYLREAISWWGVGGPVGISVDGAEGPGSYGLNRNVNVTVLVAEDHRVRANFALIQPSEVDAPRILAEVVRLIGGAVPTAAEIAFLSAPTRRPETARWTAAPQDVQLRRLICALLSAADEGQAADAAAAVEEYASRQAGGRQALANVASALGRNRNRAETNPASRYIRKWAAPPGGQSTRKP